MMSNRTEKKKKQRKGRIITRMEIITVVPVKEKRRLEKRVEKE